ncbi:tobamovirus multiplication protein 1 isoform X2 [Selaginella moellendorffii]|uniref:tobamovirus multiplication protein 1 isoform X2 n=1 Tax=Selaginella moellendorffii TaxID=88036 RepID=UPI000D1CC09C|nr:tobamovirus multiplication protein 1 isoform X2 [Selaginella moellendorffii]|eukprot:XP_024527365.1 tobamovirus multiplication protein 1 isoform X2 [Selaginella moellendorffii]
MHGRSPRGINFFAKYSQGYEAALRSIGALLLFALSLKSPRGAREMLSLPPSLISSWWHDAAQSKTWIFTALGGAYTAISLWALVQLIRIERRVPEYGWTIQKLFHLLNFVVNGVRAIVFYLWTRVSSLPLVVQSILVDLPGLLFFTTYTLLILFWADIYHQARSITAEHFRTVFVAINVCVYVIQLILWIVSLWIPKVAEKVLSTILFSAISLAAAIGFLLYGGRLYCMLRRFPVESKGREKKIREVGAVTGICSICFVIRSVFVAFSAISKSNSLDVTDHPILNAIYYGVSIFSFPLQLLIFGIFSFFVFSGCRNLTIGSCSFHPAEIASQAPAAPAPLRTRRRIAIASSFRDNL